LVCVLNNSHQDIQNSVNFVIFDFKKIRSLLGFILKN